MPSGARTLRYVVIVSMMAITLARPLSSAVSANFVDKLTGFGPRDFGLYSREYKCDIFTGIMHQSIREDELIYSEGTVARW